MVASPPGVYPPTRPPAGAPQPRQWTAEERHAHEIEATWWGAVIGTLLIVAVAAVAMTAAFWIGRWTA